MHVKPRRKRITCANGATLSVQASQFHYCLPRLGLDFNQEEEM